MISECPRSITGFDWRLTDAIAAALPLRSTSTIPTARIACARTGMPNSSFLAR
jgi:hypothetical protein